MSRCDTEILPHLYERDGDRVPGSASREVRRSRSGTAPSRRAVLARDRLGVKPLYWARVGDLVVFASELKSVLASGLVASELDYEALDLYFTFGFIPGPRTPLRGVSKLAPRQHAGRRETERSARRPTGSTRSRRRTTTVRVIGRVRRRVARAPPRSCARLV